jgi:hypothetical protein
MSPVGPLDESPGAATIDAAPPVATIEIDRFCDGCGYNLRTQPVRREERTQILIVRCPECGRFAAAADAVTAARPWLHRLATLLLFGWVLFVLWIATLLCVAQGAVTFLTLEERTTWEVASTTSAGPAVITLPFNAATTTAATTITLPPPGTTYRLVVSAPDEDDAYVFALAIGISLLLGFGTATMLVVAMHHWRRWLYVVPVVLIPTVVATIVSISWSTDAPELARWARPMILAHAACHFAGGLLGVLLGRAFARMLVCVLLPPRVRPALGFLWLADGKPPPAAE